MKTNVVRLSDHKLIRDAERRLREVKKRRPVLSNADRIRELTVVAIKAAGRPLSIRELTLSFDKAVDFNIRREFLIASLVSRESMRRIEFTEDAKVTLRR